MTSNYASSENMDSTQDDTYVDETPFIHLDNDLDSDSVEPSSKRKHATHEEETQRKAQKVSNERAKCWFYYDVVYLEEEDGVKRRYGKCKSRKRFIKADTIRNGITGVTLKPGALLMAGELLRTSFQVLGASILPLEEKIRYGYSVFKRKFVDKSVELYVPKFSKVIQHYCLPTSGKSVIMEIGKRMKLKDEEIEAALMTMHRFGNQSSSALWYELAYIEGKERVKVGDTVLQLGLGSGTKCTGLVWKCIRPIVNEAHQGPWADTIHNYPVSG